MSNILTVIARMTMRHQRLLRPEAGEGEREKETWQCTSSRTTYSEIIPPCEEIEFGNCSNVVRNKSSLVSEWAWWTFGGELNLYIFPEKFRSVNFLCQICSNHHAA